MARRLRGVEVLGLRRFRVDDDARGEARQPGHVECGSPAVALDPLAGGNLLFGGRFGHAEDVEHADRRDAHGFGRVLDDEAKCLRRGGGALPRSTAA